MTWLELPLIIIECLLFQSLVPKRKLATLARSRMTFNWLKQKKINHHFFLCLGKLINTNELNNRGFLNVVTGLKSVFVLEKFLIHKVIKNKREIKNFKILSKSKFTTRAINANKIYFAIATFYLAKKSKLEIVRVDWNPEIVVS